MTTEGRRSKLVSEANYHATKHFSENLLAIEMKKTKVIMNKPVYLGMSILDISKILMYVFWYDYIKPKYGDKAKMCYTDNDSFISHIITGDFYEDIAVYVERWFDTSSYNKNEKRSLPIGKDKKVPGLFKDELEGKIIIELVGIRPKAYTYLIDGYDDDYEKSKILNKKAKGTKKRYVWKLQRLLV